MDPRPVGSVGHFGALLQHEAQKTDCGPQLIVGVGNIPKNTLDETAIHQIETSALSGAKVDSTPHDATPEPSVIVTQSKGTSDVPGTSSESPKKPGDGDKVSE